MTAADALFDPTSLPKPADPNATSLGLERWAEQAARCPDAEAAAFARAYAEDPAGRRLLEAVFGNSPFLTQAMVMDLPFARRMLTEGWDAGFDAELRAIRAELAGERDMARLMARLRVAKRRVSLVTALADMAGAWDLARVTGALSTFAEDALRLSCNHLLSKAAAGGALILPEPERPSVGSGLIILAMGKFGARELNYSSDIDLIVLYDDHVVQTTQPDNMARTFVRLARDLVRIMEERTRDGYVFRTDLRLRPDPGATPLAVSISAAESYYGSLGQNWERAAMIKARAVAGDLEAGAHFLRFLVPFVWRRSLDFAAIQDIHSIKRQINAHRGYRTTAVNGHNVKLGRGGIREIEFFAQTQQLIFGGRDPTLRTSGTVESLLALVAAGRIERSVADDLIRAYGFLRKVEHRVQMRDDRQTHTLPADDAGIAALAAFMGYDAAEPFRADLLGTLALVEDHYAALFEEAPPLAGAGNLVFTGTEDDPDTLATLRAMGFGNPSSVAAAVRAWHHGRYRATRSTRARELLTELAPTLLRALGDTANPDDAFNRFDEFLARLPAGVQLFSMFYSNPNLLNLVAEIMGSAPRLAGVLSRNPNRLDAVLTPGFFDALPSRGALAEQLGLLLRQARDFEDVLNITRRWTNDQIVWAGIHILRNITDGERCGPFLSDVADLGLAALEPRVTEEFARRHGRFDGHGVAILALGKLGSRQMTLRSDLDLIMVYDVPPDLGTSDGEKPLAPNEYFIRLTQRMINAVTAPTGEGRLYDVDMRLRPSGNAGPLAISLESFARYQANDAWTWEHMALTRARVIHGPPGLVERLEAAVRGVLTRPRDPDKLLRDVSEMRARIDKEFGTTDIWDVKYVRGGTIDVEFVAQYLMLRHAAEHPEILSGDAAAALRAAARAGLLDGRVADDLCAALSLWRRIQGFLRLTTEGRFVAEKAPAGLRQALIRAAFPESADDAGFGFDALEAKARGIAARAHRHFVDLVDEPAARLADLG
ncbi:bifunctional [glutamine synthetase] adenylyltransferase/[glutamine synthetase]-adenylyl-L-tyrosine phosphorylase [Skermanella sp. TT6]|uniref:Bifunctional glutamine synthetase adenylyltransferase/adenylyl-removing enzyme n=1 Tax=Skermanella cutis TaxID=2775420 RepID=A0ABX7B912_9PROT|nr:bifunctional [glutamine synthetase] adenylyltransferase/[glutamine synthetase]-adenylyl-L-tyrosine phosphorylase [Skermanella sp. TT6]QQP90853.1 bifunctional [glutamine synthetase] adenylyltransferase/[glutamine synthetase]-adenylyl-L-tyrosine phosphorylase [Skermanella sp. TT6]